MKRKVSRFIACVLAFIMVCGMMPVGVQATAGDDHTISLDPNGGMLNPVEPGLTSSSIYVFEGEPYQDFLFGQQLLDPSRSGYDFNGWYTSLTGGTRVLPTDKVPIETATTHVPSTLYARWDPQVYKINLDPNGGTVNPTSIASMYGDTYGGIRSLPTPVRSGYTFNGWYTAATGGSKITDATTVTTSAKGQTLYAQWTAVVVTPVTHAIHLDANGGVLNTNEYKDAADNIIVVEGNMYGDIFEDGTHAQLLDPTRAGYTFIGWFNAATGGNQIKWDDTVPSSPSATLYAHWASNSTGGSVYVPVTPSTPSYTVSFNAGGGTVTQGSKPVYENGNYGEMPIPTRNGYIFDGWYTAADGGTRVTSATQIANANVTLYAHWILDESSADNDIKVSMDTPVNGNLVKGHATWYAFTAPSEGYYEFATTGNVDNYGALFAVRNSAKWIAADDDSGVNANFRIVYRLAAGQTVYLRINGYSDSTPNGAYTLTVRKTTEPDSNNGGSSSNTGNNNSNNSNTTQATKVTLNKKTATVNIGSKLTLKATITPQSAASQKITWSSSNTKVAKVSSTGVVTGVKAGTATITAKTADGAKITCKITVKKVAVKKVTLNKKNVTIKVGKKVTLKATVTPTNATIKTVTYSSSNKKIATVTSKGVVKGIKKGTVTITVKTKDGKKTASCKVKVK